MRMIDADALDKLLSYTEVEALKKGRHFTAGVINGIRASIDGMVSVDPERKTGKWIKDEVGTVVCSVCKRPRRDNRVDHITFCNACGADMRGDKDERFYEMRGENDGRMETGFIKLIDEGIVATNTDDVYSVGMRNGMRWCKSIIDGERPEFEEWTGRYIDIDKEIKSIERDIEIYETRRDRYKSNPKNGMVDSDRMVKELQQTISDAKKEIRMLENIFLCQQTGD